MRIPWWWPFGRVDEIAPRALEALLARDGGGDIQLIDVREEFEYQQGHVVGARSVPIHTLPQALDSLRLDPQRPIVAICLSGHRSIPAFRLLKSKGYEQVYSLAGGMMAWRRDQLPTIGHGAI